MSGDRERCLSAGCNEYMAKPIDRRRLVELVRELAAQAPKTDL
jgi:CheY-like chemotaxis protein